MTAASQIGSKLNDNKTIYHPGSVTLYLGKVPKKADWDGSGKRWFKVFIVTSVCEAKVTKGLRAYPRSRNGEQLSDRLFSLAPERAHLRQRYQPTFLLERQVFRYYDPEAHDGSVSSFTTSSEQSRSLCISRNILNSSWGAPKLGLQEVRRIFRKFLFQDTSPKKVRVCFLNIIKSDTI